MVDTVLDHPLKLLNLKQVCLKDWESSILSGSIQLTLTFSDHTQKGTGQTQVRLVSAFVRYPSSLRAAARALGAGSRESSLCVSHSESGLESLRAQS